MKTKIVFLVIAFSALVLTACGGNDLKDAKNWPLEEFSFTNQENMPFGTKDLKGKVWVADFIFTNCETVCSPMTANMAELQRKAKAEGIKNIQFVSFSVDPEVDSPEALKAFSLKFDADLKNWNFLTGYSQAGIEHFAVKNFQALVQKPEGEDQVVHGTSFYLVGQDGKVKKYYSGVENVPYETIIEDIKTLQ